MVVVEGLGDRAKALVVLRAHTKDPIDRRYALLRARHKPRAITLGDVERFATFQRAHMAQVLIEDLLGPIGLKPQMKKELTFGAAVVDVAQVITVRRHATHPPTARHLRKQAADRDL